MDQVATVNMANYRWYLAHDLSEYAGKWVAINDESVVAAAPTFGEVVEMLRGKVRVEDVFFARIPEKMELIYATVPV